MPTAEIADVGDTPTMGDNNLSVVCTEAQCCLQGMEFQDHSIYHPINSIVYFESLDVEHGRPVFRNKPTYHGDCRLCIFYRKVNMQPRVAMFDGKFPCKIGATGLNDILLLVQKMLKVLKILNHCE